MSEIFIPKDLIMKYARTLSPNATMLYIYMVKEQNVGYLSLCRSEVQEMIGVAPNKQKQYFDELIRAGLIERMAFHDYAKLEAERLEIDEEDYDLYFYKRNQCFKLNLKWDSGGGFIPLPKWLLWLTSIPVNGMEVSLKAQQRILMILHLILSENTGFSFAGREYLADIMGVDERTITNLNNTLERCGILTRKISTTAIKGQVKTKNKYSIDLKRILEIKKQTQSKPVLQESHATVDETF